MAHAKVDGIQGQLQSERAAREKHHSSVGDQLKSQERQRGEHEASVKERLAYLEQMIGDNADQHIKLLEVQRTAHSKLAMDMKGRDAHHATVAERLDYLESIMGEATGRHAQEIASAHTKIDQLHAKMADDQHARAAAPLLQRRAGKGAPQGGAASDAQIASLEERLDVLEEQLGDGTDFRALHQKHTNLVKDLDAHKMAHAKHVSDTLSGTRKPPRLFVRTGN